MHWRCTQSCCCLCFFFFFCFRLVYTLLGRAVIAWPSSFCALSICRPSNRIYFSSRLKQTGWTLHWSTFVPEQTHFSVGLTIVVLLSMWIFKSADILIRPLVLESVASTFSVRTANSCHRWMCFSHKSISSVLWPCVTLNKDE